MAPEEKRSLQIHREEVEVFMTSANYDRIVGRAILNRDFFNELFADPAQAIDQSGLELDEAEKEKLITSIEAAKVRFASDQIDEFLSKFGSDGWH
jgi:hypothetical protein